MRNNAWFRPKRFGWGMTPVTWQGWALTIGGVIAVIALMRSSLPGWVRGGGAMLMLAAMIAIAAKRTEGRLRWRWGGD
ncbi:hypothetical protein [Sphingomonas sp. Leaf17]|uniref:hypothetical protein n=1 Tax=Sphingomonas sp. Leaf17 TaxID=1735683 RepID=UPI0009E74ECB|nr:hypothetical protein [Sphingomonas sp. Leaf17]